MTPHELFLSRVPGLNNGKTHGPADDATQGSVLPLVWMDAHPSKARAAAFTHADVRARAEAQARVEAHARAEAMAQAQAQARAYVLPRAASSKQSLLLVSRSARSTPRPPMAPTMLPKIPLPVAPVGHVSHSQHGQPSTKHSPMRLECILGTDVGPTNPPPLAQVDTGAVDAAMTLQQIARIGSCAAPLRSPPPVPSIGLKRLREIACARVPPLEAGRQGAEGESKEPKPLPLVSASAESCNIPPRSVHSYALTTRLRNEFQRMNDTVRRELTAKHKRYDWRTHPELLQDMRDVFISTHRDTIFRVYKHQLEARIKQLSTPKFQSTVMVLREQDFEMAELDCDYAEERDYELVRLRLLVQYDKLEALEACLDDTELHYDDAASGAIEQLCGLKAYLVAQRDKFAKEAANHERSSLFVLGTPQLRQLVSAGFGSERGTERGMRAGRTGLTLPEALPLQSDPLGSFSEALLADSSELEVPSLRPGLRELLSARVFLMRAPRAHPAPLPSRADAVRPEPLLLFLPLVEGHELGHILQLLTPEMRKYAAEERARFTELYPGLKRRRVSAGGKHAPQPGDGNADAAEELDSGTGARLLRNSARTVAVPTDERLKRALVANGLHEAAKPGVHRRGAVSRINLQLDADLVLSDLQALGKA